MADSTTPTTIALGTYYVSENDEKATGPGAAETGTVTFLAVEGSGALASIPSIPFVATDPNQIAAIVPGASFALTLVAIPPAAAPPAATSTSSTPSDSTDSSGSSDSSDAATSGSTASATEGASTTDSSATPEIPAA